MKIYTQAEWNNKAWQSSFAEALESAIKNGGRVWHAPDGAVAIATLEEMEEHAQKTGDNDWTDRTEEVA
jgi:hypothetical protein